jgi:hypothetical protein
MGGANSGRRTGAEPQLQSGAVSQARILERKADRSRKANAAEAECCGRNTQMRKIIKPALCRLLSFSAELRNAIGGTLVEAPDLQSGEGVQSS